MRSRRRLGDTNANGIKSSCGECCCPSPYCRQRILADMVPFSRRQLPFGSDGGESPLRRRFSLRRLRTFAGVVSTSLSSSLEMTNVSHAYGALTHAYGALCSGCLCRSDGLTAIGGGDVDNDRSFGRGGRICCSGKYRSLRSSPSLDHVAFGFARYAANCAFVYGLYG